MQVPTGSSLFRSGFVVASLIVASVIGTFPSVASTVGPTGTDLATFAEVGYVGSDPNTSRTFLLPSAVGFSSIFEPDNYTGFASVDVGASLGISYSDGDVFRVKVTNTNENPWVFSLILDGSEALSTTIAVGSSYIFAVALAGTGFIGDVAIRVAETLPIIGPSGLPDRTAQYAISAVVPLPPALLLFASGVIGLGLLGRRRKNKASFGAEAHA